MTKIETKHKLWKNAFFQGIFYYDSKIRKTKAKISQRDYSKPKCFCSHTWLATLASLYKLPILLGVCCLVLFFFPFLNWLLLLLHCVNSVSTLDINQALVLSTWHEGFCVGGKTVTDTGRNGLILKVRGWQMWRALTHSALTHDVTSLPYLPEHPPWPHHVWENPRVLCLKLCYLIFTLIQSAIQ